MKKRTIALIFFGIAIASVAAEIVRNHQNQPAAVIKQPDRAPADMEGMPSDNSSNTVTYKGIKNGFSAEVDCEHPDRLNVVIQQFVNPDTMEPKEAKSFVQNTWARVCSEVSGDSKTNSWSLAQGAAYDVQKCGLNTLPPPDAVVKELCPGPDHNFAPSKFPTFVGRVFAQFDLRQ